MPSLTPAELERRLDALLNPVLSSRRTAAPLAQAMASLARDLQDFALHWIEVISRTNYELAYQFAAAAPAALGTMDTPTVQSWIISAMDGYDRAGLFAGSEVFGNFAAFAIEAQDPHAVNFGEAAPVIELFVCGLSGRRLKIDSAPAAWTDTETLYLPPRMAAGATREQNFLIYKIMATLLWAQCRYGTFAEDLGDAVKGYANPARALEWLGFLETLRLEAQITRVLPGLARDMRNLSGTGTDSPGDAARYAPLHAPGATVRDSITLLDALILEEDPPRRAWTGRLRPAEAADARTARLSREKKALQTALADLFDEQLSAAGTANPDHEPRGFSVNIKRDVADNIEFDLTFGGEPVVPSEPVRHLLGSILQDLDDIPPDYLTPARTAETSPQADDTAPDAAIPPGSSDALFYDEWDYQRHHYRKNWCVLRETDVIAGDGAFVETTLRKYAPQVAQLKRCFEMLRGEDRLLKRMKHGDNIDLDAVIAAYADMRSGRELSERLLTKRHKTERNLAAIFMVDMSGSTKGWINDAEREALVLLAEALEVLGDRYAIYGFSGITRKRCEIYRIKRFDEPYTSTVRQRIAGVRPQDYTRMGAAIRHLTTLLQRVEARTKLLITLSDGKPDDYSDHYRGQYGIEDTRQALIEAHRAGIKPFCVTIDREARDYLPHMYGAVNWTLVDDVSRLPLKVAEIYRRLTT